jgi:L-fucose mutarotase
VLKNIDPVLGPELLWILAAMGHGDELAVVDANYPARGLHSRCVEIPAIDTGRALTAISTLFPIDDFVTPAVWHMTPDGEPGARFEVHERAGAILQAAEGRPVLLAPLERSAFYARARAAFAAVVTTDDAPYACFLLTKGVVRAVTPPAPSST